jgi:glycosyltransferase involved in cell wall biosynthesis
MIYLMPEIASALGDDTFWTWAQREFPNSVMSSPTSVTKDDVLLRYSTNQDPLYFPDNTIALMWELYPEMKVMLGTDLYDFKIDLINKCGRGAAKLTVTSPLMTPYYAHLNRAVDVLPIAVNTELFKPGDKQALRAKYDLPANKQIGFWCGNTHHMKGFDRVQAYAAQHPDIYWVIVWKWPQEAGNLEGARNYTLIPQQQIAELMGASDFFLSCSRLRPFYMVEWEAMACNMPIVITDGMQKDFVPSANPRDDVFRLGWDRHTAKNTWLNYINNFIASKHENPDRGNNVPPVQVLRDTPRRFLRRPPR